MKDKILEMYDDNKDLLKSVAFISIIAIFWDIVL
jgi:hypothetical protein